MKYADHLPIDLRELAVHHLGKPLAASKKAALWRCPACPPERHALLMVSAGEYKCLSGYVCDGSVSEWRGRDDEAKANDLIAVGETA
jgi:hypothetical protein